MPIDYLPSVALANGMSKDLAQYLVAIFNAASLFGRLLSGFMADKLGKFTHVCHFLLHGRDNNAGTLDSGTNEAGDIAFAVLFGFFSGSYVALIAALPAQISPVSEIGFRTGLVFFIVAWPGLTTAPIAGAILDNTGSWVNVKVFAGVLLIAGTTVTFACRIKAVGTKFTAVF